MFKKPLAIAGLIAILILPIAAYLLTLQVQDEAAETDISSSSAGANSSETDTTSQTSSNQDPVEPADTISATEVVLKTTKGDIRLTLFPEDAPFTVKNFVTLGKRGYYNDVTFHRVIEDFMIQGGDPTGSGSGGESIYGPNFKDEFNEHKIEVGSLAMANTGLPGSNSSQFFIVTQYPQPHLDGKHTCFGKVADEASLAVVRAIAGVDVDANARPTTPVTITGFEVVK